MSILLEYRQMTIYIIFMYIIRTYRTLLQAQVRRKEVATMMMDCGDLGTLLDLVSVLAAHYCDFSNSDLESIVAYFTHQVRWVIVSAFNSYNEYTI